MATAVVTQVRRVSRLKPRLRQTCVLMVVLKASILTKYQCTVVAFNNFDRFVDMASGMRTLRMILSVFFFSKY